MNEQKKPSADSRHDGAEYDTWFAQVEIGVAPAKLEWFAQAKTLGQCFQSSPTELWKSPGMPQVSQASIPQPSTRTTSLANMSNYQAFARRHCCSTARLSRAARDPGCDRLDDRLGRRRRDLDVGRCNWKVALGFFVLAWASNISQERIDCLVEDMRAVLTRFLRSRP